MGAEKRLQRKLDRANKGTGNTTEATDNREEIVDVLGKKGGRLYDKINKGSGIKMISPLDKKKTSCWTGYSNIVDGKPTYKKKGNRTVPDCKPIN
jgi:hypothetical protein